jgi:hypothetical protein
MRTTIELDEHLHTLVQRQAQREGLSMARLLGRLVAQGLRGPVPESAPPVQRSGRFTVLAPASAQAHVASSAVQKVIDEEGIL